MLANKIFNSVLLTASALFVLLVIAKLAGVLQYAFVPTSGNEPTIKRKSFVFMTNVLPFSKYKILAYNQLNKNFDEGVYLQRLVGIENDKIQLVNGNLFVNDSLVDKDFNLKFMYKIDHGLANQVIENGQDEKDLLYFDENYFLTSLSKKQLNNNFFYERYINNSSDSLIEDYYHENWTGDNFGPIKVPRGKLFFVGDNRNESLDSRYLGFVDKTEVIGRLIYPTVK